RVSPLEIITPRLTPWIDATEVARDGIALVCPVDQAPCLQALETRAAEGPAAGGARVSVSRTYLGTTDAPERFVIAIVPPRE
ncbi:MAG TPA: hypothetical protein VE909_07800, partial [Xanthobacteraceae bacterium]|nr:hypothetical protein [Xanthobacteraceae bacterium]